MSQQEVTADRYHIKISSYVILQEHERESRLGQSGPWGMLLTHLPQIAVAERSYGELGFLLTKNKGFLRKDVGQMCVSACACVQNVQECTHSFKMGTEGNIWSVKYHLQLSQKLFFFFVTLD
jgi:hypothetical protein